MRVKYTGETDFPYVTNGNVYEVIAIEKGPDFIKGTGEADWLRIQTDMDEDYLFLPTDFEEVEE